MKPDWKDAPEWAQWLAMDSDGSWRWHEHRPTLFDRCHAWAIGDAGGRVAIEKTKNLCAWHEILESRPEE